MIVCNNQYGFREKHSALHALISSINKIANVINDKRFYESDFSGLLTAFDTIGYSIRFKKMDLY